MKIPYNILIQIKMSVRPYFKGFTLIFIFYNCRKQEYIFATEEIDILYIYIWKLKDNHKILRIIKKLNIYLLTNLQFPHTL